MDSARRELLLGELLRLQPESSNPMVTLIRRASSPVIGALVACCDQYMNAETQLVAQSLATGDTARVQRLTEEVARALRDVEAQDAVRVAAMAVRNELEGPHDARALIGPLVRYLDALEPLRTEPRRTRRPAGGVDELARAWHGAPAGEEGPQPAKKEQAASAALDAALGRVGVQAHHDRLAWIEPGCEGRDWLVQFLAGCARLATEAREHALAGFDEWMILSAAWCLYLKEPAELTTQGLENGFAAGHDPRVEEAALAVIEIEWRLVDEGEFPLPYADPFACNGEARRSHSCFASRVVLLALALDARAGRDPRERDDFMDSILQRLWLGHASERNCAYESVGPAAGTEASAWDTFVALELPHEYDSASEWRKSAAAHGSAALASAGLRALTFGELRCIAVAGARLVLAVERQFADSALVAIAAKFGCLYRNLREPPTEVAIGSPAARYLKAASHQIQVLRKLAADLHAPVIEPPIVARARGIYFADAEGSSPRDGFDWKKTRVHWSALRTSTHLADGVAGPHLWLYGKLFQRFTDSILASTETNADAECRWHRIVRFIFLVPYLDSRRINARLADWEEGSRGTASQMKTALRYICASAPLAGLDLHRNLSAVLAGNDLAGITTNPFFGRVPQ